MARKRVALFLLLCLCQTPPLFSQTVGRDLEILQEDLRIEQRVDGGFHLFIRKKPDIGSVLLAETTRDPELAEPNYAYRVTEWNPTNGDEIRLIDGAPVPKSIFSLVDSTPEPHPEFGEAFHIYIPYLLYYGYDNTRHGEIYVVDGTYFNIRSFVLPYADYRRDFKDNPFVLKVTQKPLEGPPEGNYMKDTIDSFTEIAGAGKGALVWSRGAEDLVDKIAGILDPEQGKALDLVICLDTTGSMRDEITELKNMLPALLAERLPAYPSFRVGLVLYKDYNDAYITRVLPFTDSIGQFETRLKAVSVGGGKDIPEAVYEALYDGAVKFSWKGEARHIILIGDAPPHPRQRGSVSKAMVDAAMAERNITVNAIILPQ
jgi:hypothetical protein